MAKSKDRSSKRSKQSKSPETSPKRSRRNNSPPLDEPPKKEQNRSKSTEDVVEKPKRKPSKTPPPGENKSGRKTTPERTSRHARRKSRSPKKSRSRRSPDERYNRRSDRGRNNYVGARYYDVDKKEKEENRRKGNSEVVGARYYDVKAAEKKKEEEKSDEKKSAPQKKALDPISSKTGGAYIPPAMLKLMQASITDKASSEYQRISWEALKKSIHGLINKVNKTNIDKIIRQLLKENIVRGRGLLCRSIIQAQAMSTTFTHVYAALVALINSRFPNIGELLLKRLVIQFRRGFKRNDKVACIAAVTFVAHLVNQRVAHEILALEILTLLVETPTDDSIEVAIAFLKECGMKLTEVSSKGVDAIIEMLRNVLHDRKSDSRSMHMIEVMMQIRKDKFKDHPSIQEGLDLVEEEDQFTHLITLDDATDGQDILNVFKFDAEYLEHEEKFKELSKEIVGDESDDSDDDGDGEEGDDEENEDEAAEVDGDADAEPGPSVILDNTETNLVALRRTIYLTIYSSLDFEECAHKLLKMNLKPGQEPELCAMILDCCCEMRTYERFFGLLAQRFCQVNNAYIPPFENLFKETYNTVHRLKTNQCRNVAKLFAHLLFTDAISWNVLASIRLNEDDTTSSGRIFIKILFHELSEYMGLVKLNERVKDVTMAEAFGGLFPRDNPRSTRFSINFFTSIGLGGLTDELREHLKTAVQAVQTPLPVAAESSSSSSSESSSSSPSPSSSSSSSTDDSSDESSKKTKKKKKTSSKKKKSTSKKRKTDDKTDKQKQKKKRS